MIYLFEVRNYVTITGDKFSNTVTPCGYPEF